MEFLMLILLPATSYFLVSGSSGIVVSKKDFKELNIECYKEFSCRQVENQRGITNSASCECDELCFQRGTCCYDSYYTGLKPPGIMPSCKILNEKFNIAYYLVDRCPHGGNTNPSWEGLCKNDWSAGDDMINLVPVISMHTLITYKNYFCFRCHELIDEFQFWNVRFEIDSGFNVGVCDDIKLKYDKINNSWMATIGDKYNFIPVEINLETSMYSFTQECKPNLISQCSGTWSDNDVSDKCNAYMARVYIKRDGTFIEYKNPHCAVCNFENVDNLLCYSEYLRERRTNFPNFVARNYTNFDKRNVTSYLEWYERLYHNTPPSHHLININVHGDEKRQMCNGNFLWDPFERECRNDICALPIYKLERGECILS